MVRVSCPKPKTDIESVPIRNSKLMFLIIDLFLIMGQRYRGKIFCSVTTVTLIEKK
jgi:hypothetical protein